MFGVIGGIAVAGAITAGAGAYSSRQASKAADKAGKRASQAAATELEFSMQQYEDWQAIYGPIQDRLSNYFQTTTASTMAAPGLQELQRSVQQTQERINAQVNLGKIDATAAQALRSQAELQGARGKAEIRMQAPLQLAQAQQSFIATGKGNPAAGGVIGALQGQQAYAQQQAMQQQQIAGQGAMAAGQAISSSISAYFDHQAYTQRTEALAAAGQAGMTAGAKL